MAGPLRFEYEGAHYHVTSRGNEQKAIFRDDTDRQKFVDLVGRAVEQFEIRVHAYVLMDNHYHLLIETPQSRIKPGSEIFERSLHPGIQPPAQTGRSLISGKVQGDLGGKGFLFVGA